MSQKAPLHLPNAPIVNGDVVSHCMCRLPCKTPASASRKNGSQSFLGGLSRCPRHTLHTAGRGLASSSAASCAASRVVGSVSTQSMFPYPVVESGTDSLQGRPGKHLCFLHQDSTFAQSRSSCTGCRSCSSCQSNRTHTGAIRKGADPNTRVYVRRTPLLDIHYVGVCITPKYHGNTEPA